MFSVVPRVHLLLFVLICDSGGIHELAQSSQQLHKESVSVTCYCVTKHTETWWPKAIIYLLTLLGRGQMGNFSADVCCGCSQPAAQQGIWMVQDGFIHMFGDYTGCWLGCLSSSPNSLSRLLVYSGLFHTVAEMLLEGKSKSLALGVTQCYFCLILLTSEALRDTQIQGRREDIVSIS